jgi:ribulose-phosphate 3-epimerase
MSRSAVLQFPDPQSPLIAPSMLKCDFGNLQREVALLEAAGAQLLHWDVMDGRFVRNLSYGAMVIESVRPLTDLPFDAHLMIAEPARYVDAFLQAGCDAVTFHIEAEPDARPLLRRIRDAGALAGLALNPGTPVDAVVGFLPDCDLVLVMSVEPGFGGQKFIPAALEKLRRLKPLLRAGTRLSIDGGVDATTIGPSSAAGADLFVVGSAIFDAADYSAALRQLSAAACGGSAQWAHA